VRLPAELLERIDARAAASGQSRAGAIRGLLAEALPVPAADGVDRAQIRRMRSLSPRERIDHMAGVANAQARIRGAVIRSVAIDVGDGKSTLIAALDDVIASKRAAGRKKDVAALPYLDALADEIKREATD
jgi:metal-responsive CopG/Arc/MetJ family transcriptional regulator